MTESITISPQRKLGDIVVDCTIEEQHQDRLTITKHPVEQGAQVSDHAYLEPQDLVFHIGFSNSSPQASGAESYIFDTYQSILALQGSRSPFEVITGKRTYKNMLIANVAVTTDEKTEAVLMATITCQQVIIVQTQAATVPSSSVQKDASQTGAVTDRGTVQAAPAALSPAGT